MDDQKLEAAIATLLDRSERMEKLMLGNGQPGLLQKVAALEEADKQAAKAGAKAGATSGTAATMVGGLILLILGHFGIKIS